MSEKNPVISNSFVGLDLSLTGTGFCLKRGQELIMKTIKTTPKTSIHDIARLQYIRDELMKMIPSGVSMVCVEDFFIPHSSMQMNAAKVLIMLGTTVRLALVDQKIPFYIISPQQLKKYGTGKGNGPKGLVIREIYKRWGVDAKDDNQADATVLAYMAEALFDSSVSIHQYQVDTLDKVRADSPKYNID